MEKAAEAAYPFDFIYKSWLRELDLNQRPSGYEPDDLSKINAHCNRWANRRSIDGRSTLHVASTWTPAVSGERGQTGFPVLLVCHVSLNCLFSELNRLSAHTSAQLLKGGMAARALSG